MRLPPSEYYSHSRHVRRLISMLAQAPSSGPYYYISHTRRTQAQQPARPHISWRQTCRSVSRQCARRCLDRQETDRKRAGVGRARMADGRQGPMERRPSDHRDNRAGPGAFGMTEIDSPIIPTEMLPVPSSNVTPNMNLPTPNPANDSGSGPDAFSASGLTFNMGGSINLGLADEGGAYNAGFGSDPGSGSGSGLGKGASSFGQTFPRSIRSPSFMFSAGSSVDPVNEQYAYSATTKRSRSGGELEERDDTVTDAGCGGE